MNPVESIGKSTGLFSAPSHIEILLLIKAEMQSTYQEEPSWNSGFPFQGIEAVTSIHPQGAETDASPGASTCTAWSSPFLGLFPPSAVILRKHTCAYHLLPSCSLRTILFMSHGNETQTSSSTEGNLDEIRIGIWLAIKEVQMPPGRAFWWFFCALD